MPRTVSATVLLLAFAVLPPIVLAQTGADKSAAEKARAAKDAAIDAQIRSYRCVGADGKKYYGSMRPAQCAGVAVEALSAQGTVLRRIPAPLTPEQRAAMEAEAEKNAAAEEAKRDAQAAARVQARRNQALLQTYTSEHDIDMVRQRTLADNQKARQDVERRIGLLKKRQDELAKLAAKLNKEGATPDSKFEQDVRAVAYDLDLQQQLLKSREREAAAINARYDEEKRKYVELTKGAQKK
jgi:hypothetical protein